MYCDAFCCSVYHSPPSLPPISDQPLTISFVNIPYLCDVPNESYGTNDQAKNVVDAALAEYREIPVIIEEMINAHHITSFSCTVYCKKHLGY